MPRRCLSVFLALPGFLLVLAWVAFPAAAASGVAPTDATANVCPTLTLADHLSALFGRDTALSSWCCTPVCQTPWDASQEVALRWEMERWIRANRTVGMFPESYQFVKEELMRLTTHRPGDGPLHVGEEKEIYAKRANATLREMPWLLVSNSTFDAAQQFYQRNVQRRPIIRFYHLSPESSAPGQIYDYIQQVAGWWAEAERRVSRDPRVAAPLLPWISLEKLIGPPVAPADSSQTETPGPHTAPASKRPTPMPRHSFRFHPPLRPLPTTVVFYYTRNCIFCARMGVAFDLLPLLYRRLCEYGHRSVVSCSPLVLFFRVRRDFYGKWSPTFAFHGVNSRPIPEVPVLASFVSEMDEVLDPVGSYGFHELRFARADIALLEMLEKLVGFLQMYDVIQLRLFSGAEVAALDGLARAKKQQEKRQQQSAAPASNESGAAGVEEKEEDLMWQNQHLVEVKAYLHQVVMFHVRELWGNSTTEFEKLVPRNGSQLEITWVVAVSAVLSVVWLAVLICVSKNPGY
ncbi:uncharacterized protein Tco025E_05820 [Trypanosoma conorhini]|uniref:Thioredoxin domain-containing protein n=1 Tax=Trypanosoma conorhini TaxID=83891 RepID=A0A422P9W2_9TRYP|nr:uncharacterized protein Tco025E_05820 [Trypanosoma conorhini]RNF14488.1 hypothetical protein Tco025E_05820 [Trypanosoma conorhini]